MKNGNNRRGQDATLCSGKTHHFYSVAKEFGRLPKEFCLAKLLYNQAELLSGLLQLLCKSVRLLCCRV
ncbi:hypothetical protein [Candidatus Electronema sp. PJ]|uniref:hypothetical protein n=1 Tax=Candidatus Electronema sp. PJ TaxID=3401572 RepID=UPI003AA8F0A0